MPFGLLERAKRLELSGTTWTALRAPGTRAALFCIVRWQDGIAPYSISLPSSMERAKRLELSGTTWTALRAPETRAALMERPQALERPQRY